MSGICERRRNSEPILVRMRTMGVAGGAQITHFWVVALCSITRALTYRLDGTLSPIWPRSFMRTRVFESSAFAHTHTHTRNCIELNLSNRETRLSTFHSIQPTADTAVPQRPALLMPPPLHTMRFLRHSTLIHKHRPHADIGI